jgi:membrane protein implicated in regulation of membrane protease activity
MRSGWLLLIIGLIFFALGVIIGGITYACFCGLPPASCPCSSVSLLPIGLPLVVIGVVLMVLGIRSVLKEKRRGEPKVAPKA